MDTNILVRREVWDGIWERGGKWAGGELDSESRSGIALRRQEEEIKKVKWESRKGNMRAEREIRKQKGKNESRKGNKKAEREIRK